MPIVLKCFCLCWPSICLSFITLLARSLIPELVFDIHMTCNSYIVYTNMYSIMLCIMTSCYLNNVNVFTCYTRYTWLHCNVLLVVKLYYYVHNALTVSLNYAVSYNRQWFGLAGVLVLYGPNDKMALTPTYIVYNYL